MICWLNPVGGVSGDMLLGALLDLGAPLDDVRAAVAATGLRGWSLDAERVRRGALTATRAVVTVHDTATERRAAVLLDHVAAWPTAVRAVRAIAEVEARIHGVDPAQVHLHEIGGLDTVVDTVGVASALDLLGVTDLHCGPLPLGRGTVTTRHGVLPLPAPATTALLAAAGAAVTGAGEGETVTPTGAALLIGAAFGPVPPMRLGAVGYGAGGRDDPDRPNVLQALLGEAQGAVAPMILLETNVDDVTGEVLGHLVARLLDAGAADAWITPIVMKKGRPAHTVHVLTASERTADCERIVFAETGSLGLRRSPVDRVALPRRESTVDVGGHSVRVKHGPWGSKPEHDDVAAAAAALGLPLREVARLARDDGDGRTELERPGHVADPFR
ncbi:nickel pincer cofactor biosynthesis protein LarC [Pseudonocardia abyssalis]|uniref:Pyridinium-3,5-bisthiocarboxylic acid mononucleotide nickel insertion protein n=1 Tax=Pseudonocardia abyssalis TaxID=2792008 RepID=A0ABS6UQK8_9PSEU|nr:nickel pincer cofactor biosynthesis protein LarC [Pseudonocardia abyssalis]MBW0117859.1 nickel pincer cofactor biosynthesis protein LarC [Pseudonocardia abyssalis]MBW0134462.1 nickel pincer cofactor biosynthesis protein LarC [Pseudonocardia abyssalis]